MKNFLKKLTRTTLTLLSGTVLTFSMAGCMDKENEAPEPEVRSFVSFYQASPDAPDLDILINNRPANNQPFKYTNFYSYSRFTPGEYEFKITPANAANVLTDITHTFEKDAVYSMFTVGRYQNLEIMVVKDSIATPESGKAGIRVVHLSPDAPAVNIATTGTGAATLSENLDFKDITSFIQVAGGTQSFQVTEAENNEVLLSVPNLNVQAGRVYTFVLRGFSTPPAGNTNVLSLQVIQVN